MRFYFNDNDFYTLERQKGLLYITIQTIHEGSPDKGKDIKLVLDTGAYLTVISRGTAIERGFDKLPKKETRLYGFSGSVGADLVSIPGLRILGRTRTHVPVLIPHDMYIVDPETGIKKQTAEVLGLNVLEYYNYYIDSENERLYLSDNPNPKFYDKSLESGQVFTVES